MKTALSIASATACMLFCYCKGGEELAQEAKQPVIELHDELEIEEYSSPQELDLSSTIAIDALRSQIESLEHEHIVIAIEELEIDLQRKWSEIHLFTHHAELVRIQAVSKHEAQQQKEFYFDDGSLRLVAIKEDISVRIEAPFVLIDRLYYYRDGEIIGGIVNGIELESFIHADEAILAQKDAKMLASLYQH